MAESLHVSKVPAVQIVRASDGLRGVRDAAPRAVRFAVNKGKAGASFRARQVARRARRAITSRERRFKLCVRTTSSHRP